MEGKEGPELVSQCERRRKKAHMKCGAFAFVSTVVFLPGVVVCALLRK